MLTLNTEVANFYVKQLHIHILCGKTLSDRTLTNIKRLLPLSTCVYVQLTCVVLVALGGLTQKLSNG